MVENVKIQYLYVIENHPKTRNLTSLDQKSAFQVSLNGRYHIKVTVLNLVLLKVALLT